MKYMIVSAEEFCALILEHRPEMLLRHYRIGSFDWEYCRWSFAVGNVTYEFGYNNSAHAHPDLPNPISRLLKAKHEHIDICFGTSVILQPAEVLLSES